MSATRVIRSGIRGARRARGGRGSSAAGPFSRSPSLVAAASVGWTRSAFVAMAMSSARSGTTREPQRVPPPADRVQQPRLGRVDLAAQVGDVRLDDVGLAVEVVVPHMVQDLRL